MARDDFFDNLRMAWRSLLPPRVNSGRGQASDFFYASRIHSADLWLTPKAVDGFDPADFSDWPRKDREQLVKEVGAFLAIAKEVPPDKPATKRQSTQARKHLEKAIEIVGSHLLREWITALNEMMEIAAQAAKSKGWCADQDDKKVQESLLGTYKAPRLRIKSLDVEVVFDPIALFGSGRKGVVDLVVLPTYETEYYINLKNGDWHIVAARGNSHSRPFNEATFISTITRLTQR